MQLFRSWRKLSAAALFGLLAAVQTLDAAEMDRPFVDEGIKDSSFQTFREDLRKALREGDIDAVVAVADENIRLDFGDGAGQAEFRARLMKGVSPEENAEKYRKALARALAYGGRFTNPTSFEAPYTFTEPLAADQDFYDAMFVVAMDVPVRKDPSFDAEIVGKVSFELTLYNMEGQSDETFMAVTSEDKRVKGYVERQYLQSPIDYRAIFDNIDGKWVMTAFIAGD